MQQLCHQFWLFQLIFIIYQWPKTTCQSQNYDIHLAIEANNLTALGLLLEDETLMSPVDAISIRDKSGRTPLLFAIETGQIEAVKKLLSKNRLYTFERLILQAERVLETGDTALHFAIKLNRTEVLGELFQLLTRDESEKIAFSVNNNQQTPFHVAIAYGRLPLAKMVLQKLTSKTKSKIVRKTDIRGRTAIHMLAMLCNVFGVSEIDEELAPNFEARENVTDMFGDTPLDIAIKRNCIDFVKMQLLKLGQGGCVKRNRQGFTPLHVARRFGFDILVEAMLTTGKCSLEQVDACGIPVRKMSDTDRCDSPPLLKKGTVKVSENIFCLGSKLEFTCSPGYIVRGSNTLECTNEGKWQFSGHCEVNTTIKCTEAPRIENGIVSIPTLPIVFGSTVHFTCYNGYVLHGLDIIECNSDGKWLFKGRCQAVKCEEAPPVIENAAVSIHHALPSIFGSTGHFTCNQNYILKGSNMLECDQEGKWHVSGHCEIIKCDEAPTVESAIVSARTLPSIVGSTRNFTCKPNYLLKGSNILECLSSGKWQVSGFCEVITCKEFPTIENGMLELPIPNLPSVIGATLNFTCNFAHVLKGSAISECNDKGKWQISGRCEAVTCNQVPEIENADISVPTLPSKIASTGTFSCIETCILLGSNIFECNNEGKWKISGRCEAFECGNVRHVNKVRELLGANVTGTFYESESRVDISRPLQNDEKGDSLLHLAARQDNVEAVKFLSVCLKTDHRIAESQNNEKQAPIHVAALHNSTQFADFLLEKEGSLVGLKEGNFGRTVLHLAAGSGHLEFVKLLVEKFKANFFAKSDNQTDYESQPIHLAAEFGHLPIVEYLLERRPGLVDAKNNLGNQPLHSASLRGQVRVVDFLISKQGVNVDLPQEKYGRTPLHIAASEGHLELCELLVKKYKADLFSKTKRTSDMPIHLAAHFGHLEVVNFFLEMEPALLEAKNNQGNQPIHSAALGGQVKIVEFLVEKRGVDANLRQDRFGRTPLHQAANKGHFDLVKSLVTNLKADIFAKSYANDSEEMPIHLSAVYGHIQIVDFFVKTSLNLTDAKNGLGNRPIHKAALGGQTGVVDYLIEERGVDVDSVEDFYGRTPLHIAASEGRLELCQLLVNKHHANLNAKSSRKDHESMPIHLAAVYGHLPVVEFFLEKNPDLIDAKDFYENRPLHKAVLSGKVKVVDYLLTNKNVSVNLPQGSLGRTPLHQAAEKGRLDLVKLLVKKYKADVFARSNRSDFEVMPIHLAAWKGRFEVVKFFIDQFPDLGNAQDFNGKTPLMRASESGKTNKAPQIVDWLTAKMKIP